MEIAARLLKEEDKYKRRGKVRERELVYKDKFQKEMGNLAREERLRKWMTEHTRDQVELLDPTSRRPWEPSSATDIPKWSFGLGTADYKTMVKVAQNPKLFDAKTINVMLPRRYVLAKKREEQEEAGEIPVEREKPSKVEDEDEDEGVRAPPVRERLGLEVLLFAVVGSLCISQGPSLSSTKLYRALTFSPIVFYSGPLQRPRRDGHPGRA